MKILQLLFITLMLPAMVFAQTTTSSISGTVRNDKEEGVEGATITATHLPSGSVYNTLSKKGGNFTLPNLRVGGPYTLSVVFVGMRTETIQDISLALGEPYNVNIVLVPTSQVLTDVQVTTTRRATTERTGTTTNVSSRQITTLPTISRSINDFTRLTPQASGNNIAGRDARYNNVTVDGANLNNNFGISNDPLPGGGNQPISLDAIDQVTVSIAPYDVRQSNFTGANIAAITKSGTNTFRGTAYTYYRDQSFNGRNVGGFKLPEQAATTTRIIGGTLGGPIIKNKLFFFVNAEKEKRTLPPGTSFTPRGGSGTGNISNTPVDSLAKLSTFLKEKYGYETGAFDNFPNNASENYKILGKVDWNIARGHKLTAKYNELVSENDANLNSTSVPNNANTGVNIWTPVARFGTNAMSFYNSNYKFKDVVRSGAIELNSSFGGKFSNQFISTFTKIRSTRVANSALFPFIDIIGDPLKTGAQATYAGGARNNYMSVGLEPFSNNNDAINDIFNITNNVSYYAGKHNITLGGSYEGQYVGNMFMPGSQSYYTYGSLADFMNPTARPIAYSLTFSRVPGKEDGVYSAEMKIAQLSLYAQDEYTITPSFKLTYGLRLDRPSFPEPPLENPAITALSFPGEDGKERSYSTGRWPKATNYFSPRVSFRWDIDPAQQRITFRGGTGIYTGRIPFVYLTNMPTNSGMYQVNAVANAAQLAQITFNPNPKAWQSLFAAPAPVPNSAGFVLIDENYKFPQVWRSNLGLDKKLPGNWIVSMDALYTKDLNATVIRNANQTTPTGVVNLGGSTRPSFANTSTATRRKYNAYANALVLENFNAGGAFSFTTQISKSFTRGFYGSLAYNFSEATDVTANPGSTAISTWGNNPTSGTQNDRERSVSNFSVPHRIVGTVSYRKEYIKHLATTVSLYYDGAPQGRFSYIYGAATGTAPTGFANTADINYDGNSQDLMYIPKNASEITFTPLTVGTRTYTAQEQSDAFFAFVAQDKYLSKRMGQVANRNGVVQPFYHRMDLKFLQDIFTNVGNRKHTVQLSLDCTNFLNLVNKDWGVRQFFVVNNPLRATKNATTGEVRYQMATYTPVGTTTPVLLDRTYVNNNNTLSTWALQLGVRYIF